ncbi:MAG: hypothetical protein GY737_10205 [Desulfobacteraceae bacterium]|nr:hypothetical protein [Desulfobacteraceae bacterium]
MEQQRGDGNGSDERRADESRAPFHVLLIDDAFVALKLTDVEIHQNGAFAKFDSFICTWRSTSKTLFGDGLGSSNGGKEGTAGGCNNADVDGIGCNRVDADGNGCGRSGGGAKNAVGCGGCCGTANVAGGGVCGSGSVVGRNSIVGGAVVIGGGNEVAGGGKQRKGGGLIGRGNDGAIACRMGTLAGMST